MRVKLTLRRRMATAARWPLGAFMALWSSTWHTTQMRRSQLAGDTAEDSPPQLPAGVGTRGLQLPEVGVGPLFHRRYEARVGDATLSPRELMSRMRRELTRSRFPGFRRLRGGRERIRVGDAYLLRMPGPWYGPLRVVDVTPTSFRLATLEGHPKAGQVEFQVAGGERTVFTIESWARSGDRLSNLLYDRWRMAREIELQIWGSVLERVMERAGARREGVLEIETRRLDQEWPAERLARSARKRRALAALSHAPLNFDRSRQPDFTPANGWDIDDHRQPLPEETAGPPVPGGSWDIARRLMRGYEFADPSIVRAFYDPEAPLEGRNMLLELRFLGLRFLVGTRVTRVYEETRTADGRKTHVWGWSYATLEGHLEQGEMSWEVHKWLDTGEVEFRIHAYSRRAQIENPLTRFGFRLVGRREQLRFARTTCARMRRLTEAAIREGRRGDAVRRVAEQVTARPARGATPAHEELARNVKSATERD
jgi:uncharacterized protein (UPF0548 family)